MCWVIPETATVMGTNRAFPNVSWFSELDSKMSSLRDTVGGGEVCGERQAPDILAAFEYSRVLSIIIELSFTGIDSLLHENRTYPFCSLQNFSYD